MSRIGKLSVSLPEKVTADIKENEIFVKGPKGELKFTVPEGVEVKNEDGKITCRLTKTSGREGRALWGTTRARIANLVQGVSQGWRKELTLVGVGYKAQVKGKDLELAVGYSHPVIIEAPAGISFAVAKDTITIEGHDNVLVGQMAANIRAVRKPEPYKGKGIRYKDEVVRRKVGKVAGATE